jgi:AraC-like DNA-binding protein
MTGEGWAVAAMTAPGGLGALVEVPAHTLTDRVVLLGPPVVDLDADVLAAAVSAADGDEQRVAVLRSALCGVVERVDPVRLAAARQVAAVARIAEEDRSLRRVEDLAARAGVSARTLQRLFSQHAGVSPTWVLRRYRLLEAAELVRHGDAHLRAAGGWARLAAELGYSDQPHLGRDFKAHFGVPPAGYAARHPRPDRPPSSQGSQSEATSLAFALTASAASRNPVSSPSVRSRSTTRRTPVLPSSASTPR